ncbi:MAG: LPS assembly lipoprotein LptE [Burkholderiales bacterium]
MRSKYHIGAALARLTPYVASGHHALRGLGPSRLTFSIVLCALVTACGFHLRGQATLSYESMYISGSPAFATQLARAVRAGSKTRIVNNPKEAEATLQILTEARERSILSLSSSGRVRELQIRYRVSFRVNDKAGKELLAANEILLKRDLIYSDTDVLGKEQEEALLYRDMQNDAVQQVVRRLEAARLNAAAR